MKSEPNLVDSLIDIGMSIGTAMHVADAVDRAARQRQGRYVSPGRPPPIEVIAEGFKSIGVPDDKALNIAKLMDAQIAEYVGGSNGS